MAQDERPSEACEQCLRRSWLLGELSAMLDHNCRADGRLIDLLALEDGELLQALAGRRRSELSRRYAQFRASEVARLDGAEGLCCDDERYPPGLARPEAPRMLHLTGGVERLHELTAGPVVAILGSRPASDYGVEMAGSLARGLTASGVTVASDLADAIASAAQAGVLEADGASLVVLGDGLDIPIPARRRALLERLKLRGCAVSELSCGVRTRIWGAAAAKRTLAAMAGVTVLVEAEDSPRALLGARFAQALGGTVGVVPGRVTSPVSRGTHVLLREGAQLVRDAADVLDLLYVADGREPTRPPLASPLAGLEPRLLRTLERVGAGLDTPGKLLGAGKDAGEVLQALGELESIGLLARGDGGRYVPRGPLPRRAVR
jgi:DNA processing protein